MATYRLQFARNLLDDWEPLAIVLGVPANTRYDWQQKPNRGHLIWDWLDSRGRLNELADACRDAGREDLAKVVESGLTPVAPQATPFSRITGLEEIINQSGSFLNIREWFTKGSRVMERVCRVEIQGAARGTGFLVGPDVVLTNYHVLDSVIQGKSAPEQVKCRFGYSQVGDAITSGVVYPLATPDWLIAASPCTDEESKGQADQKLPGEEELDFALVRLQENPGQALLDPKQPDSRRGWMYLSDQTYPLESGTAVYIVQHPQGQPMKLVLESNGNLGLNTNQTRCRYRTNTESGSSGSPCFTENWELFALHHYGDPAYIDHPPEFNQGVPVWKIHQYLSHPARNLSGVLGEKLE